MMNRLRSAAAAGALATLLFSGAAHAQANEAEAKVHYQKGVDLYNDGAYTNALAELEKAYALSPHYRVLYSLALVRAQLSDFVGALRGFQEYLAAAVDETPQRKAEVKERIEQLQQRVATVTVKVNVEDAEVYIDDQLKGTSPMPQPILVNPGSHKIYAKKGTAKTEPKALTLNAGSQNRIALELEGVATTPSANVAATTTSPPPPPKAGSPLITIGLITTGVLAAGAATMGVLTLTKRSSLEEAQSQPNSRANLESKADDISTFALVTDILTGAAVVAGGVTLYMILTKKPEPAQTGKAGTWLTAGPTSLGVAGRF